jgi:hypothetical protein
MRLAFFLIFAGSDLARADAPRVCIQSFRIDHTEVKDDRTILFHMIDHSVCRNTLQRPCFGLRNATRGFNCAPDPGSDEIWSHLETIRANEDGNICELGVFEKLTRVNRSPR